MPQLARETTQGREPAAQLSRRLTPSSFWQSHKFVHGGGRLGVNRTHFEKVRQTSSPIFSIMLF